MPVFFFDPKCWKTSDDLSKLHLDNAKSLKGVTSPCYTIPSPILLIVLLSDKIAFYTIKSLN